MTGINGFLSLAAPFVTSHGAPFQGKHNIYHGFLNR